MAQHIRKLNLLTLVGAAILFLLPWTNVQCSGRDVATQSGVQAIYGGASLSEDLKSMADEDDPEKPESEIDPALLIAGAAVLVLAGLVVSGIGLYKGITSPAAPGALAAAALTLILLQAAVGFPINHSLTQSNQESSESDAEMAQAMAAAAHITAERTSWFYLELVLLALPAGLFVYTKLPHEPASTAKDPA